MTGRMNRAQGGVTCLLGTKNSTGDDQGDEAEIRTLAEQAMRRASTTVGGGKISALGMLREVCAAMDGTDGVGCWGGRSRTTRCGSCTSLCSCEPGRSLELVELPDTVESLRFTGLVLRPEAYDLARCVGRWGSSHRLSRRLRVSVTAGRPFHGSDSRRE